MQSHFEALLEHYGVEQGLRIARKHLAWYGEAMLKADDPALADFRAIVNRATQPEPVIAAFKPLFAAAASQEMAA